VITVTPKPVPSVSSVAPNAINDTLVITPNAPYVAPTTINLQETAQGAVLVVSEGDAGTSFGTVANTTGSLPFTVTNTGNLDAPLQLTVGGIGFDAGVAPATATADGGTASGVVTFTPTTSGPASGSLAVSTTAIMCSAPPALVSYSAEGEVPVAEPLSSSIALSATCGAGVGTAGSLLLSNTGNAPLSVVSASSQSGFFTVTAIPSGITSKPGSISIEANGIGQNLYAGGSSLSDNLLYTTNEPGNPQYTVPVTIGVNGANLSFGGDDGGLVGNTVVVVINDSACNQSSSYAIMNTGNVAVSVSGLGSYPTDGDSDGGATDLFNFGDTFAATSATQVGANSEVTDTVSGNSCGTAPGVYFGTQSFSALNATGGTSGICIPLPTLNLDLSVSPNECCD
jgi:hypothetical protein